MREVDMNKKVAEWISTLPMGYAHKRKAYIPGLPDVTGCIRGIRLELEGKLGNNKPTRIQRYWLKAWASVGAITFVYYSINDAKIKLAAALATRGIEIELQDP